MENTEYNKIDKINSQIKSLKITITAKINFKFKKLVNNHKELLIKYLLKLCLLAGLYFKFDYYVEQLTENECQDIFGFLNLLLPYFDLTKCANLESLDVLFKNLNNKAKNFESSYYIDHSQFTDSDNYLEEYFNNTIKSIDNTFSKIYNKLLPNWINSFPYTLNSYKSSFVYNNLAFYNNLVD